MENRAPFEAVGRCIYCGIYASEAKLSTEHIFPSGIGGRLKLPAASCDDCAEVTKKLEEHCQLGMFQVARHHFNLRQRRKHITPKDRRVLVRDASGARVITLPIRQHPTLLTMPDIPPPAAFGQDPLLGKISWRTVLVESKKAISEPAPVPRETILSLGFELNIDLFRRTLAKIAHAYACAKMRLENLEPFLPRRILGLDDDINHFVGGQSSNEHMLDHLGDFDHQIQLWSTHHESGELVFATLRLFASFGMPSYDVFLGRARQSAET